MLRKIKDDHQKVKQFIEDFPDIYIFENDDQKRERLRNSNRRTPQDIVSLIPLNCSLFIFNFKFDSQKLSETCVSYLGYS